MSEYCEECHCKLVNNEEFACKSCEDKLQGAFFAGAGGPLAPKCEIKIECESCGLDQDTCPCHCPHDDLDPMEGCPDCGAEYHEGANMDPDLEDR